MATLKLVEPNQAVNNRDQDPHFEQFGDNAAFVRELYALYLKNSTAVGGGWGEFFSQLGLEAPASNPSSIPDFSSDANAPLLAKLTLAASEYRIRGHLSAKFNPLASTANDARTWNPVPLDLSPQRFGISATELDTTVTFEGRARTAAEVLTELAAVYTHTIGFEFTHLIDREARDFLQARIEAWRAASPSPDERRKIYEMLVEGETFESELHKKFVGQKRFSLQGGESLMPMLDALFRAAGQFGVKESVIGMAHRGRLDVLTAFAGKSFEDLFNEFLDNTSASINGDGDVKYHLGSSAQYAGIQVTLVPNPSHLEFVSSIVEGISRARQDCTFGANRAAVLPVTIHGDAAFAGQGCVFETLGLSAVPTYSTGGTINIVINNQVGFTTRATEARSSVYCTDMAKAVEAPVFHVNGDDPEACAWVIKLALEYRMKFARDVVVDMYCYRKYGHNEGDDPTFTQPLMYKEIQAKKSVMTAYGENLVAQGILSSEEAAGVIETFKKRFNAAEKNATQAGAIKTPERGAAFAPVIPPTVDQGHLKEVAKLLISAPSGFEIHPKLQKILEKRGEQLNSGSGIEWGLAEALAFGTLLNDGVSVRLSGQDCGRGTFSHRHILLSDYNTAQHYAVLSPLADAKRGVRFEIMNSILSETAVMGFEFGYAATAPKSLVIWEAQFGDFANGAQVIIDQFLASSEMKWGQHSALTLLLPHGFEGQGPEHSSARLERFLQLCAQNNMMVAYPTSAAQIFHLMRLQGLQTVKRPLVVMSPKSLLRAPHAASTVADLVGKDAGWKKLIVNKSSKPSTAVIACSGKVAFDLLNKSNELGAAVDIVRVEQLYPLPVDELKKLVGKKTLVWAQEEPENMGAFRYIQNALSAHGITPKFAGRRAAASPATGSPKYHAAEQKQLVEEAFALAAK